MEEVGLVGDVSVADGSVLPEHVVVRTGEVLPVLHDEHDRRSRPMSAHLLEPIQHVHRKLLHHLESVVAEMKQNAL